MPKGREEMVKRLDSPAVTVAAGFSVILRTAENGKVVTGMAASNRLRIKAHALCGVGAS